MEEESNNGVFSKLHIYSMRTTDIDGEVEGCIIVFGSITR